MVSQRTMAAVTDALLRPAPGCCTTSRRCGLDTAATVSVVDEVVTARQWWVDEWPDGAAFVTCLVAQDVQEALLDQVGRWPLCSVVHDPRRRARARTSCGWRRTWARTRTGCAKRAASWSPRSGRWARLTDEFPAVRRSAPVTDPHPPRERPCSTSTPPTREVARLLEGVADDQLADPTPVGLRRGHPARPPDGADPGLHLGGREVRRRARGGEPPRRDLGGANLDPDWRTELPGRLTRSPTAWTEPAAWEGMTEAGGVTMPGEVTGVVALDEVVLHGWDLARGTGQEFRCDPASAEAVLGFTAELG